MKRKYSQRQIVALPVEYGRWKVRSITQDARRSHRWVTADVSLGTVGTRASVRRLAKTEGASLIVWVKPGWSVS